MSATVLMPALSPTMEKGKLAKWLKKEGDTVKSGDILAEIETDKATMEVEAVDEGTLGKIMVAAGTEDVLVNTLIAVIVGEGEKMGDVPAAAPAGKRCRSAASLQGDQLIAAAPARRSRRGRRRRAAPVAGRASSSPRSPSASPRKRASTSPLSRAQAPWPHCFEGRGEGKARCCRTCSKAR